MISFYALLQNAYLSMCDVETGTIHAESSGSNEDVPTSCVYTFFYTYLGLTVAPEIK